MSFDLKTLFTYVEVKRAFSLLRNKKQFRPENFGERDRYKVRKKMNALGHFIKAHKGDNAYELYDTSFGSYTLTTYHGTTIRKKSGKFRPLLVPVPADRLVFLTALERVRNVLKEELQKFSALGVGTNEDDANVVKGITKKILEQVRDGYTCVLALDFQDFFSSIDRERLYRRMRPLFKKHNELPLYKLVKASIENGITADATFEREFAGLRLDRVGVPQGLAYSPLLAAFFGIIVDRAVRKRGLRTYRYLDDMIVLARSRAELMNVYRQIRHVSKGVGLRLHPLRSKTKIVSLIRHDKSIDFLGIEISRDGLKIPGPAIQRFKDVIATEILGKSKIKNNTPDEVKEVFCAYVDGWVRYYKTICPAHFAEIQNELNDYIKTVLIKKRPGKRLYEDNKNTFCVGL